LALVAIGLFLIPGPKGRFSVAKGLNGGATGLRTGVRITTQLKAEVTEAVNIARSKILAGAAKGGG
jgi:hypothetical protein